jgi:hypothetical protein
MSAVAADTAELYRRFKSLTVAASAALILGEPLDAVVAAVEKLDRDAAGSPAAEPVARLRRLVGRDRDAETTDAEIEELRTSHRSLRRKVWATEPCEYVPCCASGAHEHR